MEIIKGQEYSSMTEHCCESREEGLIPSIPLLNRIRNGIQMELQCPNCATPIEAKNNEIVVCNYCGILLKNYGSELEELTPDD